MKKLISLVLASLLAATVFASCAPSQTDSTATSSANADLAWLGERLGSVPDNVTVGLASDLGIDMSAFEDDGYLIRTTDGETVIAAPYAMGLDLAVRRYAKAYEDGHADSVDAVFHEGARIERLTVARRDISDYTIVYEGGTNSVIRDNAPTADNAYLAATDLSRMLDSACRVSLPVSDKDCEPMIKIGYLTDGEHGEKGYRYRVEGGNVYIDGVPTGNGCHNGICAFLENECGFTGLLYGDTDIAEAEHVDIPEGACADVSPLFDYMWMRKMYKEDYANARNKYANAYCGRSVIAHHGQANFKWGGYDGHNGQLCYTDENNYYSVVEDVLVYLEDSAAAGTLVYSVDLAMGDNVYFCHCKNCMKVIAEENAATVGPIVRFINRVADEVGQDWPDMRYLMFAYAGTNQPPVTVPSDKIDITFCTDHYVCANHYLDGSEQCDKLDEIWPTLGLPDTYSNPDYAAWLEKWCEMSGNVYVWHYGLDNVVHQFTQTHVLYHDVMYLHSIGVRGIQYEAEFFGLGEGRLRFQEMMLLQYHPDMTEAEYDRAVRDLYEREFGDGGEYVLAYTKNCWSKSQLAAGCHTGFVYYEILYPEQFDYPTFRETEAEAARLLDTALSLADSATQERRLKMFMIDFLAKECYYNYFRAYDRGDTAELDRLSAVYERMITFVDDCELRSYQAQLDFDPLVFPDTLDEFMWTIAAPWREDLSDAGADPRPAPEVYR